MTTAGTTPKSARTVGRVRLDDVVSAGDNPRTHLDGIEELAASIAELGQLVPIIVERRDDGRYDLLAGHRRCAALALLGREHARAEIRSGAPLNDVERLKLMLAENAQRRPLDPFAVTEKEWAECVRRCRARNFTPPAFARAAFQQALRT